jgi:hypothetical protein
MWETGSSKGVDRRRRRRAHVPHQRANRVWAGSYSSRSGHPVGREVSSPMALGTALGLPVL